MRGPARMDAAMKEIITGASGRPSPCIQAPWTSTKLSSPSSARPAPANREPSGPSPSAWTANWPKRTCSSTAPSPPGRWCGCLVPASGRCGRGRGRGRVVVAGPTPQGSSPLRGSAISTTTLRCTSDQRPDRRARPRRTGGRIGDQAPGQPLLRNPHQATAGPSIAFVRRRSSRYSLLMARRSALILLAQTASPASASRFSTSAMRGSYSAANERRRASMSGRGSTILVMSTE